MVTNDNRRSPETPPFNHPGIYDDSLTLGRIEQSRQLCRAAERHARPRRRAVPFAFGAVVRYAVERFVEHFQPQRDEGPESSIIRDQPASCNRRLCLRNIPLSHITSLPLSTNGSAIQFHTSWLRLRQTLMWDRGSIPQQRQKFKWHQGRWSQEKGRVNE